MSGGSMIISDDLTALSEERLQMAAGMLPPVQERLRVMDWLQQQSPSFLRLDMTGAVGEWYVLANINWEDRECIRPLSVDDFNITAGSYWISDYWSRQAQRNRTPTTLGEFTIPAHGCVLLAVRKIREDSIQYLGSNFHFTQGREVKKVTANRKGIRFLLDVERTATGVIHLSVPANVAALQSTQNIDDFYPSYEGIYSLEVEADPTVEIELKMK
jgi:alpha-galactosidase